MLCGDKNIMVTRRALNINVDGYRSKLKKKWVDCVKDDIGKQVSTKMTVDRQEWEKKTYSANPTY